jgi:flagellar biosynthesis anti-sigma factor FlgM
MEINGANTELVLNKDVQRLELSQRSEPTVKGGGEQSDTDRLELSARGKEISYLRGLILSTPDIREDKVEMFQREIQNGTYHVKAEGIAEKIL